MRWRRARPDDRDGPFDLGLQVERTWLAWGRTALSFVAVGALLMHAGRSGAAPLSMVPGVAVVGCGVAIYLVGRGRHLDLRAAVRAGTTVTSSLSLHVVATCAIAAAVLGLGMVLAA